MESGVGKGGTKMKKMLLGIAWILFGGLHLIVLNGSDGLSVSILAALVINLLGLAVVMVGYTEKESP